MIIIIRRNIFPGKRWSTLKNATLAAKTKMWLILLFFHFWPFDGSKKKLQVQMHVLHLFRAHSNNFFVSFRGFFVSLFTWKLKIEIRIKCVTRKTDQINDRRSHKHTHTRMQACKRISPPQTNPPTLSKRGQSCSWSFEACNSSKTSKPFIIPVSAASARSSGQPAISFRGQSVRN